ncbi:ester cyclase [Niveispirillum cyanobacteriorum]|uniref:Polyketide cyclase n=1 Tax=Niveispirillum cyanobacteriorum TaxID=1612173 RepID=A0A2K9NDD4_9PROT|nr:ester cyclase [Niveispirillum cyanobacteriorum]AUN31160.1 polyketide cyclase [Niveispirillum cyanobacteriorum]GGE88638.1 polyketide cyclase [Niveispirillum cyanobacteriorum]
MQESVGRPDGSPGRAAMLSLADVLELGGVDAGTAFWRATMADTVNWNGPHPVNSLSGLAAFLANAWVPMIRAFPDLGRRDDIVLAGQFKGGDWVATTGHYIGTFAAPLHGIPPTGGVATLRYGEFYRVQDGRIVEAYVIHDYLGLMAQAGCWPLPPSRGAEITVPGPATHAGLLRGDADPAESQRSLALVEAMIAGLMQYDGKTLESMGMERFWHPRMLWYGPAGIGTARGLKGFQDHHQRPFLTAFPDRVGGDHKCRIGEGLFVASTGWPSVRATHLGGGWLGCPPSGRRIGMRVMDFWLRKDGLLTENWVFIDIIDLLLQMGVDLLERLPPAR